MYVKKANAIPALLVLSMLGMMLAMPQCEKMERFSDGIPNGDRLKDAELKAVEISPAEEEAILFMFEEEKLAFEVYTHFNGIFENPGPFLNIVESEVRHLAAIENLIECFDLVKPELGDGEFNDPDLQEMYNWMTALTENDWKEALEAGEDIELADIEDLNFYLDNEVAVSDNVIRVFSNLLAASERHLEVFQAHLEAFIED